jgi:hypothetical protein
MRDNSTFSTPYSRAWRAFRESDDFKHIVFANSETESKYLVNRLRVAFDAGWNAKTSSILEALDQRAERGAPTK